MATTISIASFQTACGAVADAILAKNWSSAMAQVAVAKAIHAGLLSMKIGDAGSTIDRERALEGLIESVNAAREAASAVDGTADELLVSRPTMFGTTSVDG